MDLARKPLIAKPTEVFFEIIWVIHKSIWNQKEI